MQKQVSSLHPNIAKACNNIAKILNEKKNETLGRKHLSFFRYFCKFLSFSLEFQKAFLSLKYGSEEKGSSLCRCSILLGFIMSKKQERLRSDLLSENKITNLLGVLT